MWPALHLRKTTPGTPAGSEASAEREQLDAAEAPRIVCAACGALVTTPAQKTSMDGRHAHRFTNPAGMQFEIGCFSAAPGAAAVGEPSTVWTWFPGYAWQAAVCRACLAHLGWCFSAGAARFFGLIADRIAERDANPSA
jgi:hypothetical protein